MSDAMADKRFVTRVYAVIINDLDQVLLSDEYVLNTCMLKFPGGGIGVGRRTDRLPEA